MMERSGDEKTGWRIKKKELKRKEGSEEREQGAMVKKEVNGERRKTQLKEEIWENEREERIREGNNHEENKENNNERKRKKRETWGK